jgi:hypothetical protein
MIQLSTERVHQILYEETQKTEELKTVLRGIYTRYMHLYEEYYADIDALNDDKIAEMRKYHEETKSLVKHYYLDIPQDTCMGLREFDDKYIDKFLGSGWTKYLFDKYKEFKKEYESEDKSEETLKAEFAKRALSDFYDAMDYIFRGSFSTNSETVKDAGSWLSRLLFGNNQ